MRGTWQSCYAPACCFCFGGVAGTRKRLSTHEVSEQQSSSCTGLGFSRRAHAPRRLSPGSHFRHAHSLSFWCAVGEGSVGEGGIEFVGVVICCASCDVLVGHGKVTEACAWVILPPQLGTVAPSACLESRREPCRALWTRFMDQRVVS